MRRGDKVLDVGCGVGGPLREIAAFTGASVTGLNNNAFQISRGEAMNRRTGRHDDCDFVKADFMNIPKPDNTLRRGVSDRGHVPRARCGGLLL